jgi:peptidyl-prolyl cis-trans isomerase D
MLSFFRRLINSKIGIAVTLGVLVVIAIMFALGDVAGLRNGGGATPTGDVVATVGKAKITETELRDRVQRDVENFRQQQPTLDMAQYIAGSGLEGSLDRAIDGIGFEQFSETQGLIVTKRAIDGKIASLPGLQGPDGKFSQQLYDNALQRTRQTDASIRVELKRDMMSQYLIVPTIGATQVPKGVAAIYASLLLEKRHAHIAIVPTAALGEGTPPTDAEVAAYYKQNNARYSIPERRSIRYAVISPKDWAGQLSASDADIAAAYKAGFAKYRAVARRTVTRVIAADRATADALLAKAKAGTPLDAAARAAGLEPTTLKEQEKEALAGQTSAEFAATAFAAPKGGLIGPSKGALGYVIGQIDSFDDRALIPLEAARADLAKAVVAQKTVAKLRAVHDALDDQISNKATFDQIVAQQKLSPQTSAPVLASGQDPMLPPNTPPAVAKGIADAAFSAQPGDAPQLVPVDNESFAVVAVGKITAAAAPPLAQVRPAIVRDFAMDRAAKKAREIARNVMLAANKGTPIQQAMTATGIKLPPVQPLDKARAELANAQGQVPPPLALMFSMSERSAKIIAAPNNAGWYIIYLDKIERADASGRPDLIKATQADIGKMVGREYVGQFAKAVRKVIGVKTNAAEIAKLKATLTGQETSDQP